MPDCCSTVSRTHSGPPAASVALIRSTAYGSAGWPGNPFHGEHAYSGTTVSRGILTTVTPPLPGEMWATMIVSEQAQPLGPPIALLRPVLVSEPSSKMFSASLYLGGRCRVSIFDTCVIPESSSRIAA